MSFERIDSGKRSQHFFPDAIQNSFAVMAMVLLFIIANSAESAGSVLLSYQLPNGTVGVPYSGTISASGGTSPYTFSLVDGTLPGGLTLNRTSGSITGTPTIAATKYFWIRAADAQGATVSIQAHLAISAGSGSNISVAIAPTATRMASGKSLQFSATVQGTSNTAVIWSASAGGVSNTGIVTAPAVTTTTNVTVTATSAADSTKKASSSVVVSPTAPTLSVTTSSLNSAQSGTTYSSSLSATGGTAPYRWSLAAGALPTGFTLSGSGQLTGTTSQAGTFSIAARVTDATNVSASQTLVLSVSAATSSGGSDGPLYSRPAHIAVWAATERIWEQIQIEEL